MTPSFFYADSTDLSGELELRVTATHAHRFNVDQVKQTVRVSLFDDARGDPVALTLGLSLIEPISFGLKDPSFIHHAYFETELHASLGREWIDEDRRTGSLYALAALGLGIRGEPWMRGKFSASHYFSVEQILTATINAQVGFGNRNFHFHHFHGYGNIAYRLIDAELEYTYTFECFDLSFKYLHSLLRENCPTRMQQFVLNLDYPFNF